MPKSSTLVHTEEIFNSITHGIGWLLGILACIILAISSRGMSVSTIMGVYIFSGSLFLLYCFSTLYHALIFTKAEKVFSILDQSAIYLLIAGTYTPFFFTFLEGIEKYLLVLFIWALAITGIILKSLYFHKHNAMNVLSYLIMGWVILFFGHEIVRIIRSSIMFLLFIGGIFYSVGIFFYGMRFPFNHVIWHLFVLCGSIAHFLAVFTMITLIKTT